MELPLNKIIQGDSLEVLKTLPSESVDCVITSPPYWALRDYGVEGQLGLEQTFQEYINKLCGIFDEVKRVLKKEGTCWVNLGDTYAGNKSGYTDTNKNGKIPEQNIQKRNIEGIEEKSLCQIPSRFAIEMSNRGWILRNEIIWHKPNCMPQSATDRFTVDFEKVFLLSKNKKYYFDSRSVREPHGEDDRAAGLERARRYGYDGKGSYQDWYNSQRQKKSFVSHAHDLQQGLKNENNLPNLLHPDGRNKRSVWSIPTMPFSEAHFATFPEALIEPMVEAGCPEGGIILDPFIGAGTTALVAKKAMRNYVGIELNPEYIEIANKRLAQKSLFINTPIYEKM